MRSAPSLVLLAVLTTGCKQGLPGLGDLKNVRPDVSFKNLKVQDIDFQRIRTRFVFEVHNPYPVGISLTRNDWALGLAGQDFLDGSDADPLRLPASRSSPLRIPVAMQWADAFRVAGAAKGKDEIPYDLHLDLAFDTPIGNLRVPIDKRGTLPALHKPKVSLQALRLKNLNVLRQTASLALDLRVTSEQASAIRFAGFDYGVKLDGTRVVTGKTSMPSFQGQGTLTIPLDIQLLDLGKSVVRAIKNKASVQVGLDADVDVDTPFGMVPLKLSEGRELRIR